MRLRIDISHRLVLTAALFAGVLSVAPATALARTVAGEETAATTGSAVIAESTATESATTTGSVTTTESTAGEETGAEVTTTETTTGEEATRQTSSTASAPEVVSQHPQRRGGRQGSKSGSQHGTKRGGRHAAKHGEASGESEAGGSQTTRAGRSAPPPAGIGTPALPFSLRSPISGVPGFFVETFSVPPFLLPIYQAAGIAYGIPWQVLAAINEVETDYGRDLNVSSAGAEGWMQFMPAEWRQYGVDANGDGYKDPYNPADAIFAAARYLAAAGGSSHIRAAVYSYNHSQAYVASVMLRAQLLSGMPPDLLGAITSLTEARFPVHAPSHFADGFTEAPAGAPGPHTLVGTTIYSESEAPVIAVQDGTIAAIGESAALGRYVTLRDAYGDLYTYADLGSVSPLYPVVAPRQRTKVPARVSRAYAGPRPTAPATAGVQAHAPLSAAASTADFAYGVGATPEKAPAETAPKEPEAPPAANAEDTSGTSFAAGPEQVTLQSLQPGVHVLAGTILGHLQAGAEAHMLFQIKPGGAGAPLIDPKPVLDGWVALEDSAIFKAKGENPFLATSPTAGQALLESKGQLEQQVLRNRSIHIYRCGRADIEAGRIDRRVLASLELLSVSGLQPTVSRLRCSGGASSSQLRGYAHGDAVDITAINGVPIAGHTGPGSVTDLAERKLMTLQGTMKPAQIAGPIDYPGTRGVVTLPSSQDVIHIDFANPNGAGARPASAGSQLTPSEWVALVARLGQIPDPTVASGPSSSSIADEEAEAGEG